MADCSKTQPSTDYLAPFKLVAVRLRLVQFSLAAVALVPKYGEEDVGVGARASHISRVHIHHIVLHCNATKQREMKSKKSASLWFNCNLRVCEGAGPFLLRSCIDVDGKVGTDFKDKFPRLNSGASEQVYL